MGFLVAWFIRTGVQSRVEVDTGLEGIGFLRAVLDIGVKVSVVLTVFLEHTSVYVLVRTEGCVMVYASRRLSAQERSGGRLPV